MENRISEPNSKLINIHIIMKFLKKIDRSPVLSALVMAAIILLAALMGAPKEVTVILLPAAWVVCYLRPGKCSCR